MTASEEMNQPEEPIFQDGGTKFFFIRALPSVLLRTQRLSPWIIEEIYLGTGTTQK